MPSSSRTPVPPSTAPLPPLSPLLCAAAWGFTNETATDPARWSDGKPIQLANAPQAGVDGTDGEHPRYTKVVGCSAREIGLYEKQSSFFVQAKPCPSLPSPSPLPSSSSPRNLLLLSLQSLLPLAFLIDAGLRVHFHPSIEKLRT